MAVCLEPHTVRTKCIISLFQFKLIIVNITCCLLFSRSVTFFTGALFATNLIKVHSGPRHSLIEGF